MKLLQTFLRPVCSQPRSYSFRVFALCSTTPSYHSLSFPRFQTFHLKRLAEDALIRFPDHVYGIYQLRPANTFTCTLDRHHFTTTVVATNPPTPGRNSLSLPRLQSIILLLLRGSQTTLQNPGPIYTELWFSSA